ncbi:hypothetical protein DC904_23425 [Vibrio parahaemolyticus]|nr:hypothetical protein [Vibrio parahaemolyticus]
MTLFEKLETSSHKAYNKAFKADSQRVAFLFWLSFVFTVPWFRLGGGVAHYLTQRYVTWRFNEYCSHIGYFEI